MNQPLFIMEAGNSLIQHTDWPRLLIITDWIPSKSRGGVSQTLYNLFDWYPSNKLLLLGDDNEFDIAKDELSVTVINVKLNRIAYWYNRVGQWGLNGWIAKLNGICRDCFGVRWPKKIGKPAYIIVSATSIEKLHLAWLWGTALQIPVIPYFMDDWMAPSKFNWGTNSLHAIVKGLLSKSDYWMMISKPLQTELERRYNIQPKECLVVHNPVQVNLPLQEPLQDNLMPKKICYAGSIFNMHYDALLLTAKAVRWLNEQKKDESYQLIVYTTSTHWDNYKSELAAAGAVYGGFIHPNDLETLLRQAWLLLVTSSFDEALAHMSRSSVQTKITEYMRTGVPIISVGPSYSACNLFIKEWEIGFCFEIKKKEELSRYLDEECNDVRQRLEVSKKAFDIVNSEFSKLTVQKKLATYLRQASLSISLN